jgi:hypothetical protein
VLTLERGLVVRPQLLHREDVLAQDRTALAVGGPVLGHLLLVPAVADAEQEPAVRQCVDACDLLGGVDRIALGDQADSCRELERGGDRRTCAERDERVEGSPVELG